MAYIETELYIILGSYLRVAREASGLTLTEASKKLDTTPMTIQRYEKGDRKVTVEKIRLLCSLYGVDADKLMQDSIDALNHYGSSSHAVISITEERMLSSFRVLNHEGQSKAVEYINDLVASGNYAESKEIDFLTPVAAHHSSYKEISEEDIKHDLDLLNDDDF